MTIANSMSLFEVTCLQGRANLTIESYCSMFNRLQRLIDFTQSVSHLNTQLLLSFIYEEGLKANTSLKRYIMIRRYVKFLVQSRKIDRDPLENSPAPKDNFEIGAILSHEQIQSLESALNEPYKSAFYLYLYLGIRAGGLLRNKSDKWKPMVYDAQTDRMRIFMSKVNRYLYLPVPQNHGIKEILLAHRNEQGEIIFDVSSYQFYEVIKTTASSLGFQATVQMLRRTFGTQITTATGNLAITAGLMGHKNIATTYKYYAHVLDADKRQALDALTY